MIGLSREEFWSLSLRELWNEFTVARIRLERDRRRDLALAWYSAALSRVKEMPSLQTLLGGPPAPQSLAQQRAALTLIFGHRGKPMTKAS